MDSKTRTKLATKYIRGVGIEIGALHHPLPIPCHAKVRYVDRSPVSELRNSYPELAQFSLVEPDIIDDGETLQKITNASQDFVIANHFLEHCQDPLGTIENFVRVLKPGGVIYLAVPDKRHTFDKDRPVTLLSHLIRDHEEGPSWSRQGHYEEYACMVEHAEKDYGKKIMDSGYSIHFHVWTKKEMLELIEYQANYLPVSIVKIRENRPEIIIIMEKYPDLAPRRLDIALRLIRSFLDSILP